MPKKLLLSNETPTLVAERLHIWGRSIRTQRIRQHISAADLCARMGISDATLRRIERGDPGTSASNFMNALLVLGILDAAAPALPTAYWSTDAHARARKMSNSEDDDDF